MTVVRGGNAHGQKVYHTTSNLTHLQRVSISEVVGDSTTKLTGTFLLGGLPD
jgi:hypothetical protein